MQPMLRKALGLLSEVTMRQCWATFSRASVRNPQPSIPGEIVTTYKLSGGCGVTFCKLAQFRL